MKRFAIVCLALASPLAACESDTTGQGIPPGTGPGTGSGDPPGQQPPAILCTAKAGAPVIHDNSRIVADETWTAGSPHVVKGSVGIAKGAKVTIEPCAEVRLEADARILVAGPATPETGSLVAEGTAERPIAFVRADPSKAWGSLEVRGGGNLRLAHSTLDGGGAVGNAPFSAAALRITGDQYAPPQQIAKVDHVTIKRAENFGVFLDGHGIFSADSDALSVTEGENVPVALWASSLHNLPRGKYTGNKKDELVLMGGGGAQTVATDTTMKNLGVPYHVGTAQTNAPIFLVAGGTAGFATLTIEAGTHVELAKGGIFEIENFTNDLPATAALVAVGTQAAPIVFTSAEATKSAGDWVGLWFGLLPSPNNKLDYVHVEYAGGTTGTQGFSCNAPGRDEAAILLLGEPANVFITHTTILKSARYGIDRGWRGAALDFLPTNDFVDVASCKQSWPKDDNGACPASPACP